MSDRSSAGWRWSARWSALLSGTRILWGANRRLAVGVALLATLAAAVPVVASASPRSSGQNSQERAAGKLVALRKPPRVVILSPGPGYRTPGSVVRVRVRLQNISGHFQATLGRRNVTRRFGPVRGGVRTAVLRRGRDFARGRNQLLVSAGAGQNRRASQQSFISQGRDPKLLTIGTPARAGRLQPFRVRIDVRQAASAITVSLNGHRVAVRPEERRPGVHRFAIGAGDGLRAGFNRLVVQTSRDQNASMDREVRRFRVAGSAIVPSAGRDAMTQPGRAIMLNAGGTRVAGRRGNLIYRWRIVRRPARSRALIVSPMSARAKLIPDLPGRYQVRLIAARAPRSARGSAASSQPTSPLSPPAQPTCLANLAKPPASAGPSTTTTSTSSTGTSTTPTGTGIIPVDPVAPPACVVPVGQPTPALPLAAIPTATADDVEVTSMASQAPMGDAIQTIAADGSIQIGAGGSLQRYPGTPGAWAHLLVLSQTTLQPVGGAWGPGDQTIGVNALPTLAKDVAATDGTEIVVITGMGVGHSGGQINVAAATQSLTQAVNTLGGDMPSAASQQQATILTGHWSMIGRAGAAGSTTGNLDGFTESPPPGTTANSEPGSIDGYMQIVTDQAFDFVSPGYVPIDTKAAGSTNTLSVFTIGAQRFTSQQIVNGSLALHILVLRTDAPGNQLTQLDEGTFVIDNPYQSTNQAGVTGAAQMLAKWRASSAHALIVMQTFGEDAVAASTAPTASSSWVNDDLGLSSGGIQNGMSGQSAWDGQAFVGGSGAKLWSALDRQWNPGYPTVAGQVGDLTGPVGHDDIANLGVQDQINHNLYPVSRISMVAPNHPYDPQQSYVSGYGSVGYLGWNVAAQGRLVGTLTRDHQSNWQVQQGAQTPAFGGSPAWQEAFAPPTSWPYTSPGKAPNGSTVTPAQATQYQAAMRYVAGQLWPGENITDVRSQYVLTVGGGWQNFASDNLSRVQYAAGHGFSQAQFTTLTGQLRTEMDDVDDVTGSAGIIAAWQQIFGTNTISAVVSLNSLASTIIQNVNLDSAAAKKQASMGLDPTEILSEALYVAADVAGFPEGNEDLKLAEGLGTMASMFGLADSLTPHADPGTGKTPDTNQIWVSADQMAAALVTRFHASSQSLTHLGDIFVSDWGKLQTASANSGTKWAFDSQTLAATEQALAVPAAQQMYQALLPFNYTQWLISPYQTPFNLSGPPRSGHGNGYRCSYFNNDGNLRTKRPFASEPAGGTSMTNYRASNPPGSTAAPAGPNTVPYLIRALKSTHDPLQLRHQGWDDRSNESITIKQDGRSPSAALIDHVFEAVNPNDPDPSMPSNLGMGKIPFFAAFGGGPAQSHRMICSHTLG